MSTEHSKQRLCHISKWDHFDGYGFDLHAEKGKPGQYIGKVDDGSPAQAAGLKQGDRIIEVNGAIITGKTHRDVVELIKAVPNETKLLVISDDKDDKDTSSTDGSIESKQIHTIESHNATNNNKTNGMATSNGTNSTNSINGSEKSDNDQPQENGNSNATTNSNKSMSNGTGAGLNLNMSAAEMRARLAAKKKFDPKKETTLDFKKKFDMIQKM